MRRRTRSAGAGWNRLRTAFVATVVLAVALAATAFAASGPSIPSGIPTYKGIEAKFQHSYKKPKLKKGFKFTVAYLAVCNTQQLLLKEMRTFVAEAKKWGGNVITYDASCNPTTQVNQFDQALARPGVDAIILQPVDYRGLRPQLERAKAKGIPVIGTGIPERAGGKLNPLVVTNMVQPFDQAAWYAAAIMSRANRGGTFAVLGFAIPIPQLIYYTGKMAAYGQQLGMKYVGRVDAAGDSAGAYATAASAILAKYPNVKGIIAFNDNAAYATLAVARTSNKKIVVTGLNAEPNALKLIKSGQMAGSVTQDYTRIAQQLLYATYNVVTKQNLPLPKQAVGYSAPITKANVDRPTNR